jgi:hypothetical protein
MLFSDSDLITQEDILLNWMNDYMFIKSNKNVNIQVDANGRASIIIQYLSSTFISFTSLT